MDSEIDLESYTLSIIRLNNALEQLENSKPTSEIKSMFEESYNDLEKVYEDAVNDLNQNEVNLNEYYMFFQNGRQTFPQYIELLGNLNYEELDDIILKLINVFSNLNKIADAFPK